MKPTAQINPFILLDMIGRMELVIKVINSDWLKNVYKDR